MLSRKLDELQLQISQLERLSSIDSLTKAWNRAHFDRVVASELERSIRFKQPISLVFLDIDHFKRVNDHYGHPAGDSVLCELVKQIGATLRSSAGGGGDEWGKASQPDCIAPGVGVPPGHRKWGS